MYSAQKQHHSLQHRFLHVVWKKDCVSITAQHRWLFGLACKTQNKINMKPKDRVSEHTEQHTQNKKACNKMQQLLFGRLLNNISLQITNTRMSREGRGETSSYRRLFCIDGCVFPSRFFPFFSSFIVCFTKYKTQETDSGDTASSRRRLVAVLIWSYNRMRQPLALYNLWPS